MVYNHGYLLGEQNKSIFIIKCLKKTHNQPNEPHHKVDSTYGDEQSAWQNVTIWLYD